MRISRPLLVVLMLALFATVLVLLLTLPTLFARFASPAWWEPVASQENDASSSGIGAASSPHTEEFTTEGGDDAFREEGLSASSGKSAASVSVDRAFTQALPITLPASLRPRGYEKGTHIETWRAISDASCRDVARELLLELRTSDMRLVEANYLDLSGEAWGCTLEDEGRASVTVVLIAKRPFGKRDASNPLCMTLIRTAVPEYDLGRQEQEQESDREQQEES
jgi:hypothetical protein